MSDDQVDLRGGGATMIMKIEAVSYELTDTPLRKGALHRRTSQPPNAGFRFRKRL